MLKSLKLISEMERFVRDEEDAQRRTFQTLWEQPVLERVEEGRCLNELEFCGEQPGHGLKFRCRTNNSELRGADLVCLSRGEPLFSIFDADIHRIEDDAVWILPQKDWRPFASELATGRWVLDRTYLDLSDQMFKAIAALGQTNRGRERILPLLTGEKNPEFDLEALTDAANDETNESQAEAIEQGVAADLCHVIQGPPGTGKTYVLAKIVRERFERGERILITGPTHLAIHNALNMIHRLAPEIKDIVKIGRPVFDPDLKVQQFENFQDSPLAGVDGAYVVGATPFAARSRRLPAEFDTVIMDEASQITLPLAIMAMLSADCYLFIGDHRQLPPVVQSMRPLEASQASVFQRLQGRGYSTMLTETYRMNATLTRWPSESFYSGQLRPFTSNENRKLALSQPVKDFALVLDPNHPLVMVELAHRSSLRQSDDEATLVTGLLEHLHHAGLDLKNVGVVTPFRRQARRIRYFLGARRTMEPHDWRDCVIDTVERMQGQEREVVIISMTASSPDYLAQITEFLLLPQRLNVAVSRARSKVVLIASREIYTLKSGDPQMEELVQTWQLLRNSCHAVHL